VIEGAMPRDDEPPPREPLEPSEAQTREDIRRSREALGLPVPGDIVKSSVAAQQRIGEVSEAIRDYVEAQADTHAGWWVVYENGGEHHLSFTRDVAAHQRALDALSPHPGAVHVHQGRFAKRDLEAVATAIWDDADGAIAAAGIDVLSSAVRCDVVDVEVVAPTSEAAEAFFAARFGDRIAVTYAGPDTFREERVAWDRYTQDEQGRTLTLLYVSTPSELARVEVEETTDDVRAAIVVRVRVGPVDDIAIHYTTTTQLARPLAGRPVIDALTGGVRQPR
jgi:hypothetical protein